MRKIAVFLIFILLGGFASSQAQDLSCADVNGDGSINLNDYVYMILSHLGGEPLPAGKGDIDSRAGFNTGDWQHLVGYIFVGGPPPDCPPFNPYTLETTNDTLFLPSFVVPDGSGQTSTTIAFRTSNGFRQILIPLEINGLGPGISIDSLHIPYLSQSYFANAFIDGNYVTIAQGEFVYEVLPGLYSLADIYFSYDNAGGTEITINPAILPQETFLNYTYGSYNDGNLPETGIPTVVTGGSQNFPIMTVTPDSLFFYTLVGLENPDPQTISILSDGAEFSWFMDKTDWIEVSATFGSSDVTVDVQPDISGFQVGTYTGEITIFSPEALGSPKTIKVVLQLRSQYPSFDANCDEAFNISDVVMLINYLFNPNSPEPCDPCTGGALK